MREKEKPEAEPPPASAAWQSSNRMLCFVSGCTSNAEPTLPRARTFQNVRFITVSSFSSGSMSTAHLPAMPPLWAVSF